MILLLLPILMVFAVILYFGDASQSEIDRIANIKLYNDLQESNQIALQREENARTQSGVAQNILNQQIEGLRASGQLISFSGAYQGGDSKYMSPAAAEALAPAAGNVAPVGSTQWYQQQIQARQDVAAANTQANPTLQTGVLYENLIAPPAAIAVSAGQKIVATGTDLYSQAINAQPTLAAQVLYVQRNDNAYGNTPAELTRLAGTPNVFSGMSSVTYVPISPVADDLSSAVGIATYYAKVGGVMDITTGSKAIQEGYVGQMYGIVPPGGGQPYLPSGIVTVPTRQYSDSLTTGIQPNFGYGSEDTLNLIGPFGDIHSIEGAKVGVDPITGEIAAYKPYYFSGKEVGWGLIGGVGRYGSQSGEFVVANPKTSTAMNLNVISPFSTENIPKAEAPGADIPWWTGADYPALFTMDEKGVGNAINVTGLTTVPVGMETRTTIAPVSISTSQQKTVGENIFPAITYFTKGYGFVANQSESISNKLSSGTTAPTSQQSPDEASFRWIQGELGLIPKPIAGAAGVIGSIGYGYASASELALTELTAFDLTAISPAAAPLATLVGGVVGGTLLGMGLEQTEKWQQSQAKVTWMQQTRGSEADYSAYTTRLTLEANPELAPGFTQKAQIQPQSIQESWEGGAPVYVPGAGGLPKIIDVPPSQPVALPGQGYGQVVNAPGEGYNAIVNLPGQGLGLIAKVGTAASGIVQPWVGVSVIEFPKSEITPNDIINPISVYSTVASNVASESTAIVVDRPIFDLNVNSPTKTVVDTRNDYASKVAGVNANANAMPFATPYWWVISGAGAKSTDQTYVGITNQPAIATGFTGGSSIVLSRTELIPQSTYTTTPSFDITTGQPRIPTPRKPELKFDLPLLPSSGGVPGQGGGGGGMRGQRKYTRWFPVGLDISMFGNSHSPNPFISQAGKQQYAPKMEMASPKITTGSTPKITFEGGHKRRKENWWGL